MPHCGVNLLEHGIVECLEGATAQTEITFNDKAPVFSETMVDQLSDQWIACMSCTEVIKDVTAIDVINFATGDIDEVDGLETKVEVI